MPKVESIDHDLLPHLFRTEYTKMTAVICRLFGLQYIEIAEDIASETFLKATEIWSLKGIPDNPTAWLYTVAKNKTRDYLKRNTFFEKEISPNIKAENFEYYETNIDFTKQNIKDSQLAMIFAVCNPTNSEEALRARENLRQQRFKIQTLTHTEILSRLDAVLTTLYLLFNEGYFSKSNDNLIRKDLCSEAVRLTFTLTENSMTNTGKVNALLSLLCFQSSRLEARISASEEAILFDEQDKNLWNKELINNGNYYLVEACSKNELSKYHLEACIAYWHTTTEENEKWKYILQLYNQLILLEYSPVTALNRIFSFAKVYGNEKAISEAEKLNLPGNHYYHSLLGYLYSPNDNDKAINHFRQSIGLTNSDIEKKQLTKTLARLEEKKNSR